MVPFCGLFSWGAALPHGFGLHDVIISMFCTGHVFCMVLLAVPELHRGAVACGAWQSLVQGGGLKVVIMHGGPSLLRPCGQAVYMGAVRGKAGVPVGSAA